MSALSKKIKHQWRGAMKKRRASERRQVRNVAAILLGTATHHDDLTILLCPCKDCRALVNGVAAAERY